MRRRRHVLQVSTFPFLAVLLCTMGSLILLLVVIDRRAKAVARAKAALALAAQAAPSTEDAEARAAELEERRRRLHALLAQEMGEVDAESRAVQERIGTATANIASAHAEDQNLRDRLQAEKNRLAQAHQILAEHKRELEKTDQQSKATEEQRRKLSLDLVLLERTLSDLQAARKREQQTFSLVPYTGRRGENRKPIYIECTVDGWVLHPDLLKVEGRRDEMTQLRAEIERRARAADSDAYVFLLVRPDGITSYYRAQAAMRNLPVDFGYEFVDAGWAFDFSPDAHSKGNVATVEAPAVASPIVGSAPVGAKPADRATPPGRGQETVPQQQGTVPQGAGTAPQRSGDGTTANTIGGSTGAAPGKGVAGIFESDPGGSPTMPSGTMPPGGGGKPVGGGSGGAASGRGDPSGSPFTGAGLRNPTGPMGSRQREGLPGFGNYPSAGPIANGASGGLTGPEGRDGNGGGRVISPPGTTGFRASTNSGGSGSGSEQALPGSSTSGGGSVAPGLLDPGRPGNGSDGPASGPGVNNGPSGGSGPPSLESPSTSIATAPSSPLPAGAAGPGNPAPPSGIANKSDGSKGSGGDGGDKAASPLGPSQVPYPGAVPPPPGAKPGSSQPANPNQNGGGSDVYSEGARSMPKGPNSPAPGGEVDSARSGMEVPGPSGLPNLPGGKRTTTPPSRPPVRLSGSRDWALSVECTADAVVLPTGERITAKALAAPEGGKELRSAVEALISRKQATVREGEPPYRPLIRFLVHPDGLRLYHMAYPTLEPLQVPIVRQNVEADDHRPGEGGP